MPSVPSYDSTRRGIPCPNCPKLLCDGPEIDRIPTCSTELFAGPLAVGPCLNRYCPNCGWVLSDTGRCNHQVTHCPVRAGSLLAQLGE